MTRSMACTPPIRAYSLPEPSRPQRWLNMAFTAGLTARLAGVGPAQAIMTAAAAAGTVMAIFFAAVSAYR